MKDKGFVGHALEIRLFEILKPKVVRMATFDPGNIEMLVMTAEECQDVIQYVSECGIQKSDII